jgi:lactoylglutathione lyase
MRRCLSSVAATPRPFRVLGLQQIAVGTLSKSSAKKLWVECLGLPQVGTFQSVKENVDEDILHLGPPGSVWGVEVDVMQPLDPQASPRVHDPALNHIGLWVDHLPEAVAWLSAQGVRFAPGGIRKGAGGHDVTFMHPKGNEAFPIGGGGVLIELVQAPKEVIEGYDRECSKKPTLQ